MQSDENWVRFGRGLDQIVESYKSSWRFSDYKLRADSSEVISQSSVSDLQKNPRYFYNLHFVEEVGNSFEIIYLQKYYLLFVIVLLDISLNMNLLRTIRL